MNISKFTNSSLNGTILFGCWLFSACAFANASNTRHEVTVRDRIDIAQFVNYQKISRAVTMEKHKSVVILRDDSNRHLATK